MDKTIKALYYGNLAPYDRPIQTKEQKRKNTLFSKTMDGLEAKLPKPLRKELEDVLDKQAEVFELETAQAFVDGFRLGARFAVEAFGKEIGEGDAMSL